MQNVDIYTTAMNAAFVNSYNMIQEPGPIDECITKVPSTSKIENYPYIFPPPLMHEWKGYRQFAKAAASNYKVINKTYTAEFEIELEDYDDIQVPGWKLLAAAMAEGAKDYSGYLCQILLALGQTTTCYDGSNFFATSHTIGTGNNIVTGTAGASDGITHAMAVLCMKNKVVKPLLYQNREVPKFRTDMGSDISDLDRKIRNWTSMRGAAAFGFWHDAILVKWANTPTVTEVQTTLGNVNAAFRQFLYPKNLPSDIDQYYHGQTAFDDKSLTIISSSKIEHIIRQALTLSLIATTENPYKGFARLISSGYLNSVV